MRLIWRRAPAKEFDHELAWLGVSVGLVAGGAIWLKLGLPWPRCLFRALTGLPCVSCGLTRCTIAFLHGNFSTAWQWNPAGFLVVCALIVFDLYALIVVVGRTARLRIVDWTVREKRVTRIAIICLLALNWIYLLAHHDRF
jgi:uncharacterized protein DUF2752